MLPARAMTWSWLTARACGLAWIWASGILTTPAPRAGWLLRQHFAHIMPSAPELASDGVIAAAFASKAKDLCDRNLVTQRRSEHCGLLLIQRSISLAGKLEKTR